MATDKQREANRRNTLKSTGPSTPPGKAIAAQNSFKHGLCADDSTLYDDPQTEQGIEQSIARYFDYYRPDNPLAHDALEEIAVCRIRLRQLQLAQMGLINDACEKMFDKHTFKDAEGRMRHFYDATSHYPGDERQVANRLLGIAWQSVGADLEHMSRYEARVHNRYLKALKQFESLSFPDPAPKTTPQPVPICVDPCSSVANNSGPVPPSPSVANKAVQNEPNVDSSPLKSTPDRVQDPLPAQRQTDAGPAYFGS
jgi:hypothetical protein